MVIRCVDSDTHYMPFPKFRCLQLCFRFTWFFSMRWTSPTFWRQFCSAVQLVKPLVIRPLTWLIIVSDIWPASCQLLLIKKFKKIRKGPLQGKFQNVNQYLLRDWKQLSKMICLNFDTFVLKNDMASFLKH